MRTGLFIFLFLQLCIQSGFSQEADSSYTLFGKLQDVETLEPLIGANVLLAGSALGAATNVNGEYRIKGIPTGRWLVKVSYIGYAPQERWVDIRNSAHRCEIEQDFLLEGQAFMLCDDPCWVRKPLIEKDPMKIGTVIPQEQIIRMP